jgi:hypothetical protein
VDEVGVVDCVDLDGEVVLDGVGEGDRVDWDEVGVVDCVDLVVFD